MSNDIVMKRIDTFATYADVKIPVENHIETKRNFSLFYDKFEAVKNVNLAIPKNRITAMIGLVDAEKHAPPIDESNERFNSK